MEDDGCQGAVSKENSCSWGHRVTKSLPGTNLFDLHHNPRKKVYIITLWCRTGCLLRETSSPRSRCAVRAPERQRELAAVPPATAQLRPTPSSWWATYCLHRLFKGGLGYFLEVPISYLFFLTPDILFIEVRLHIITLTQHDHKHTLKMTGFGTRSSLVPRTPPSVLTKTEVQCDMKLQSHRSVQ